VVLDAAKVAGKESVLEMVQGLRLSQV